MDRVLIIAGSSFVGRHLRSLLQALYLQTPDCVFSTARVPQGKQLLCDLTQPISIEICLRVTQPDWIVNCSGLANSHDRGAMDRVHVDGTRNLLQSVAFVAPQARVLLFGSAAEYGPVPAENLPISEEQKPQPTSAYGQSKLAQLEVAREVAAAEGLKVVTLRPFNIVGPGTPEFYLASILCRRMREALQLRSNAPLVIANPTATRDWIDVRSVALAVASVMQKEICSNGLVDVYNVATGIETSVFELAEGLSVLAGGVKIEAGPPVESRSGIARSRGDSRKLTRATGWVPSISWQESMRDLWAWYGKGTSESSRP